MLTTCVTFLKCFLSSFLFFFVFFFLSTFFDLLNINCSDTVKIVAFFSKTDSEGELLIAKKCFKFS